MQFLEEEWVGRGLNYSIKNIQQYKKTIHRCVNIDINISQDRELASMDIENQARIQAIKIATSYCVGLGQRIAYTAPTDLNTKSC